MFLFVLLKIYFFVHHYFVLNRSSTFFFYFLLLKIICYCWYRQTCTATACHRAWTTPSTIPVTSRSRASPVLTCCRLSGDRQTPPVSQRPTSAVRYMYLTVTQTYYLASRDRQAFVSLGYHHLLSAKHLTIVQICFWLSRGRSALPVSKIPTSIVW